jgi:hypothetical protein
MPEFISKIRTESAQHIHGVKSGSISRATRESVNKQANTINRFPKTKPKLEPLEFHIYQKAGMPK